MRVGKPLIGIGIIIAIFGIVFFLQGQSLVGPKSSFMYSNPQWMINGQWIAIIGIIILGIGLVILKINSQFPKS
ncbi:MAG: hypothetical protein E6L02_07235 [Thaumarchaeota archaeon]|nr:MAG: hypothetical protein E6L02_07235 [Nitrososphaerota archaeon]